MASNHRYNDCRRGGRFGGGSSAASHTPEWADGLKQLYDSVVEEDLPDSFKHLLDRLDAIEPDRGTSRGNAAPSADGRETSQ